jgi:hypothetical protein
MFKITMKIPALDLKTDEALLNRLHKATVQSATKEELHKQRVSFVYGNLPDDSTITKQQVEAALARIEGSAA